MVAALPDYDHQVIVGDDSDLALARTQLGVPVEHEADLVRAPRPVRDIRARRLGSWRAYVAIDPTW